MKEDTKVQNHLNKTKKMKQLSLTTVLMMLICSLHAQAGSEKFVDSVFIQGKIKYNNGSYEDAIKDFTAAIEKDAKHTNAFLQRGFCYALIKDFAHAIEDFTSVISLEPDHEWAYVSRGGAYNKVNEYNKAIDDFNKALTLKPTDCEAYNNRGFSKKALGDKEGACEDWFKSKKMGNDEAYIIIKNNRCK